jgi:hypothetical protein
MPVRIRRVKYNERRSSCIRYQKSGYICEYSPLDRIAKGRIKSKVHLTASPNAVASILAALSLKESGGSILAIIPSNISAPASIPLVSPDFITFHIFVRKGESLQLLHDSVRSKVLTFNQGEILSSDPEIIPIKTSIIQVLDEMPKALGEIRSCWFTDYCL